MNAPTGLVPLGGGIMEDVTLPSPAAAATATLLHIEDAHWSAEFVRAMMEEWPEVRHAGIAPTGGKGIELCRELRPDLVLLDMGLPDMGGFAVAGRLAALVPAPTILVLTARTDEYTLYRMREAPIQGLLWKSGDVGAQLRAALAEVLAGRRYFPPEVVARESALRRDAHAIGKILGKKDIALLPLLGRGDTDRQIADGTGLNLLTVKWRRRCIMRKLDLHTRVELMRWARAKGFVD